MKILIVISSLGGGGAERVAVNLARYWAERGRAVRIVTLACATEDAYAVPEGVTRVALDLMHGAGGGPLRSLVGNLRAVLAYRREIKAFGPDVVLGLMTQLNVLVALAARGLPCATVGSERISPGHWALPRAWRTLRRLTYGRLDLVTAQTRGAADWIEANARARRTRVIPNAVSLPLVGGGGPTVAPSSVCAPEHELVLAAGRMTGQKRFDLLLRAFADLAGARPDWRLALLGDGPNRAELEALARELGVADRVLFPGRVDNPADWYARASVFALSSDFEGFPNVLAEALAHGLPAVATDCPHGPADLVREGVDGFLVPPGDAAALAARLARLMDEPDLRARMARAAPDVLQRYSEERVMAQWEAALDDALLSAQAPTAEPHPAAS